MPSKYTLPTLVPPDIARFWSHVDRTSTPEGCWLYTRMPSQLRPRFEIAGVQYQVARIAYQIAYGPFPACLFVCHHCDVARCVNPSHLFLGTCKDNAQDMVRKGRSLRGDRNPARLYPERLARGDRSPSRLYPERLARGDRNPSRLHPERLARGDQHYARQHPEIHQGERNGTAKLTEEQVMEMRARYERGESRADLARAYGVTWTAADCIVRHLRWRHVP